MLLQAIGVVVQASGLALLFLHWRTKGGLGGGALFGAWTLMFLGAAPWLIGASPEKAAALGALAPMMIGLALLAPDALPRLAGGKARRERPARASSADEVELAAAGRASRNAGRWFSALVAAPALSVAAVAAWLVYAPLGAVDTMVFGVFLMTAVLTGGLLWLLSAVRPWRRAAFACGATVLLAALAAVGGK